MFTTLVVLASVGAGIIGGVFFAFSGFVMKALAQLPSSQGVAAMQRINVVVLNPIFLGTFVGTAILCAGCVVASFFPWVTPRSALLVLAGCLYVAGTFFVTMVFNVPRNDRLARLDAESAEAAQYWPIYVREWMRWNHVRTIAAVLSAGCSVGALAV
jgi:uncharacterized membrane protein